MTLFNLLLSLYPIFPIAIVTRTRTAKSDLKRNPLFNLLGQNLEARVATVSITTRAWWLAPRPLPPPRRVPPHPARYRSRALSPRTTPNQITRAEQAAGGCLHTTEVRTTRQPRSPRRLNQLCIGVIVF